MRFTFLEKKNTKGKKKYVMYQVLSPEAKRLDTVRPTACYSDSVLLWLTLEPACLQLKTGAKMEYLQCGHVKSLTKLKLNPASQEMPCLLLQPQVLLLSLSCSQDPANSPHLEPDLTNPQPPSLFP